MSIVFVSAFSCVFLMLSSIGIASPVRLAIINESELKAVGDLLTAELSTVPEFALLERDQIAAIVREQKLTAENLTYDNALQVGHLIGAELVLLLDIREEHTPPVLVARLVSVPNGVIIASERFDYESNTDPVTIAARLARTVLRGSTQYSEDPTATVPVSLLQVRPAFTGAGARQIAEQINTLLFWRLAEVQGVVLLERQQLELLAWEKSASEAANHSFWSGRYLLSGTIEHELDNPDQLTLSLRLAGAGREQVLNQVSGPRNQLPELVEKAATEFIKALKRPPTVSWDVKAEARRLVLAAAMAEKVGTDWRYVRGLAEAGWVLGYREQPAIDLRIVSHLRSICGIAYRTISSGAYRRLGEDTERLIADELRQQPDALSDKLRLAVEALALCVEEGKRNQSAAFRDIAGDALEISGLFLRSAVLELESNEMAEIRTNGNALFSTLATGQTHLSQTDRLLVLQSEFPIEWAGNAEETIAACRRLLLESTENLQADRPTELARARWSIRQRLLVAPSEPLDRIEVATADKGSWRKLLEDLQISQDVDDRAAGLLWAIRHGKSVNDPQTRRQLIETTWAMRQDPGAAWFMPGLLKLVRQLDREVASRFCWDLLQERLKTSLPDANYWGDETLLPYLEGYSPVQAEDVRRLLQERSSKLPSNSSLRVAAEKHLAKIDERFPTRTKPTATTGADLVLKNGWPKVAPAQPTGYMLKAEEAAEPCWDQGWLWMVEQPIPAVVGVRPSDFESQRVTLPSATNAEERVLYPALEMSAVSNRWFVLYLPGSVAPWRLLIYDRQKRAWVRSAPLPELGVSGRHQALIQGDRYIATYTDIGAENATGILEVHLPTRKVGIVTNSAGRGNPRISQPPIAGEVTIRAGENGEIIVTGSKQTFAWQPRDDSWREVTRPASSEPKRQFRMARDFSKVTNGSPEVRWLLQVAGASGERSVPVTSELKAGSAANEPVLDLRLQFVAELPDGALLAGLGSLLELRRLWLIPRAQFDAALR